MNEIDNSIRELCRQPVAYDFAIAVQFYPGYGGAHIQCRKLANWYEVTVGKMYSAPCIVVNLSNLMKLSEMFGTEKIDVDNYANAGCDTCEYGSDYGHTFQIYEPTKRVDELDVWAAETK